MKVQHQSRSLVYWLAMGLALFSAQACSGDVGSKVGLPPGTEMVLAVGKDGSITVLDAKAAQIPKCTLCTPDLEKKLGAQCKDAPASTKVCPGLSGVSVQNVSEVTFLGTHKNPCYKCAIIRGAPYCVEVTCPSQ